jgi:hypothetical protein
MGYNLRRFMKKLGLIGVLLYCSVTLASFFVPDNSITTAQLRDGVVTAAKRAALTITTQTLTNTSDSSGAYVDVTGSISFTSTGRPVSIGVINTTSSEGSIKCAAAALASVSCFFRLLINGTPVGSYELTTDQVTSGTISIVVPPSALNTICSGCGAGTATYKLQIKSGNASMTASITNATLVVYEL